jgi:asparagine synthase (glutamine-hydrolysing)
MCGFAGYFDPTARDSREMMLGRVAAMASRLRHRGPDDSGEFADPASGIALGFRRLSILDLSPAGHQPMTSSSGRYVIAFNGEIYNFDRIRRELESEGKAPVWLGHSDTEVLLAAVEAWGLRAAVSKTIGMFAFALWDREERRLHLVRDRIGVKPLYWGWSSGVLLFGSELKSMAHHPSFDATIDRNAIALLLRFNYVPAPHTIYSRFAKLAPGTIRTFAHAGDPGSEETYWSAKEVAERGASAPLVASTEEITERTDSILRDSIALRMVADVPLGVFLSGGIDSSVVTALMQAQSSRPVRTFTIGFHEEGYDEAVHAREVAAHLGTDHTELYVTPGEALAVIPKLPEIFDEPFSDSSQIPTYLVSELARRHVTVCLSGDGGDEVFGGYTRYFAGDSLWRKISAVPRPLRTMSAAALGAVPQPVMSALFGAARPLLPRELRYRNPADKIRKAVDLLRAGSADETYGRLISHWDDPASVVVGAAEPLTAARDSASWARLGEFTHRMMYADTVSYLPDDIMVKVDRTSMAVSLEAREPLLDHRLIEFAWTLPLGEKVAGNRGKMPLRNVLARYVPRATFERPKMGFGVPIDAWLRGPLRDWAEDLLGESRLRQEGFFDPAPIRQKWREHLEEGRDWHYYLWDILMFQAWLAERRIPAPETECRAAAPA